MSPTPPPTPTPTPRTSKSFCTFDTEYTACSFEFCPSRPHVAVCGTYQLVPDSDAEKPVEDIHHDDEEDSEVGSGPKMKRVGRCLVYRAKDGGDGFQEIQRVDCPAVLDSRWQVLLSQVVNSEESNAQWGYKKDTKRHHAGVVRGGFARETVFVQPKRPSKSLAVPTSGIRHADVTVNKSVLEHQETFTCASPDVLCLSLDISDKRSKDPNPQILTTLSNGQVVLLDTGMVEQARWRAHDYEPWTCGFDYWDPATVWTGGDDLKLKGWDMRVGTEAPVVVNKRFEGGVTAMRSHHLDEHVLAVGSYDATLRIFDTRNLLTPLSTTPVGGGIWRLKFHPTDPTRLLVAAMHGGFKVVAVDAGRVVGRFDGHESLAYGADWGAVEASGEGERVQVPRVLVRTQV